MRISDWSSDVCSSDLHPARRVPVVSVVAGVADEIPDRGIEHPCPPKGRVAKRFRDPATKKARDVAFRRKLIDLRQSGDQIGRASCRERGCRYVEYRVVAGPLQNKNKNRKKKHK